MKTKSERFVDSKRESWKTLLVILEKISKKGLKKLSVKEVEIFPRLYRKTCQDLAEARMLNLSPDVIEYLNNITGQAHHQLYFSKPLTKKDLKVFFTKQLPFSILKNWAYVLSAFILFWGVSIGSYYAVIIEPDFADNFVSLTIS